MLQGSVHDNSLRVVSEICGKTGIGHTGIINLKKLFANLQCTWVREALAFVHSYNHL